MLLKSKKLFNLRINQMKTFFFIFLLSFTTLYSQENNISVNFKVDSKTIDTIKTKYNSYYGFQTFENSIDMFIDSTLLNISYINDQSKDSISNYSYIQMTLKNNLNNTKKNRFGYLVFDTNYHLSNFYVKNINNKNLIISPSIFQKENDAERYIEFSDILEIKFCYFNGKENITIKKIIQFTN